MTETTPRSKSRYRYLVLFMLMLVYCMSYIDRQIIGILALPIKQDLKLSDTQLGLMGGFAFAIFYTAMGIPIARLADRFNRVWIITAALTIWSGFTALCGMANSFTHLFLARLGVGVGEAGGVAPSFSIVSDYFPPRQRGRALSILTLALPIGSAAGLLIGGVLAVQYGWRSAFLVMGVLGLVLAPVFVLVTREPKRGALDDTPKIETTRIPSFAEVLRLLSRKPSFWWLSFASAAASMLSYGLAFWLPAYLHRSLGLDVLATSQVLGAATLIGGVAGILAGGWIGDILAGRNRAAYALVPAAMFLIGLIPLLGAMWVTSIPLVFILLLPPLAMNMLWTSPSVAAVQHLAPASMRATASSVYLFILNLIGLGAGTVVFGAVSDAFTARFGDDALRLSIISVAVVLCPLASGLYWLASRTLARDWEGGFGETPPAASTLSES
ncbi:spinster family MFS transporter [Brevundimonas vesicularis]|uniref:spinster family MFS transporter n=1 Tax=Brevundimonas vesicularis TaxID=41276 RepID=UPI001F0C9BD8|nr:MFS transporter [Brevundimonas vesicularis]